MFTMLSSEPASQYCSVRKYARTSCAVPGMKRSNCGIRRSIFICAAPAVRFASTPSFFFGRRRFSRAMAPVWEPSMLNRPRRVKRTTSAADMAHTMASQCSRRSCSACSTGRKWSSMNSMVATTMSPRAMSSQQRCRAFGSLPHSSAA